MAIPIAIFLTGALAQLVDGALGMGFGVSAMSLLTTLGLAPAIVSAVVHVAKIATGISSGLAHLRFGNVDQRVTLVLSLSGSVGAVIGATMLLSLAAGMVRPFVAAALLLLGLRVFAKFFAARAAAPDSGLPCATSRGALPRPAGDIPRTRLSVLGVVGGALDAVGGGGWGPVCTSSLVADPRIEPRKAIGSVNLAEVAVAFTVVVVLGAGIGASALPWKIVAALVGGAVIAAPFAAWVCSRLAPRPLGMGVGALLVMLNARILLGYIGPVALTPTFTLDPHLLWVPIGVTLASLIVIRVRETGVRPIR